MSHVAVADGVGVAWRSVLVSRCLVGVGVAEGTASGWQWLLATAALPRSCAALIAGPIRFSSALDSPATLIARSARLRSSAEFLRGFGADWADRVGHQGRNGSGDSTHVGHDRPERWVDGSVSVVATEVVVTCCCGDNVEAPPGEQGYRPRDSHRDQMAPSAARNFELSSSAPVCRACGRWSPVGASGRRGQTAWFGRCLSQMMTDEMTDP